MFSLIAKVQWKISGDDPSCVGDVQPVEVDSHRTPHGLRPVHCSNHHHHCYYQHSQERIK